MPDIYVRLIEALDGTGTDGPEVDDDKASGAGATGVIAGGGLVREIDIKIPDL